MRVLLKRTRAKGIEDKRVNIANFSVEGRIQDITSEISIGIRTSYHICQTYSNEGFLAKTMKVAAWARKLAEITDFFDRKRRELTLAVGG